LLVTQGSRRKNRQRIKVAKIHESISNRRNHFHHNLSKRIINENQVIFLEDLDIKGMMENRGTEKAKKKDKKSKKNLSKSIGDASWASFVRQLEYKAKWYGRTVIKVDRYYPSSKTCSKCQTVNPFLQIWDRKWECEGCNTVHDRDLNAAQNILAKAKLLIGKNVSVNPPDYRRGESIRPDGSSNGESKGGLCEASIS
jgi:putative transposase